MVAKQIYDRFQSSSTNTGWYTKPTKRAYCILSSNTYSSCLTVFSLWIHLHHNCCNHANHLRRRNSVLRNHLRILKIPTLEADKEQKRNTVMLVTVQAILPHNFSPQLIVDIFSYTGPSLQKVAGTASPIMFCSHTAGSRKEKHWIRQL